MLALLPACLPVYQVLSACAHVRVRACLPARRWRGRVTVHSLIMDYKATTHAHAIVCLIGQGAGLSAIRAIWRRRQSRARAARALSKQRDAWSSMCFPRDRVFPVGVVCAVMLLQLHVTCVHCFAGGLHGTACDDQPNCAAYAPYLSTPGP